MRPQRFAPPRQLGERITPYLHQCRLYRVTRLPHIDIDWSLITSLVERWQSETHTFHLPNCEMSITLQDIAIITGLPIDGNAVCGPTNMEWGPVCQNLLGVTPPETALTYGSLKITWVRNTFLNLPEGANAITTQQYARAYMFQVLALLFGNKSQSRLHCYFLQLLEDFGVAGEYSWGSATLAFLYKELCTASIKKTTEVAGPIFILQLWAWEHLPYLTPIPIIPINLNGDDPYGCRYNIYFLFLYNIVYCSVYP